MNRLQNMITRLGAYAIEVLSGFGRLTIFGFAALRGCFRRRSREPRSFWTQCYEVGNRSLLFIAVTLGFLGMVMVHQMALQAISIAGSANQVGPEFAKTLVHELAPTLTGLMLATRVGAGIGAELAAMKTTDQLDAMRMAAVNPVHFLVSPRLMASIIMTVALTFAGGVIALMAGRVIASYSFGVNPAIFVDLSRIELAHVLVGLTKAISYGAAIPLISAYCGFQARPGSEGVGRATTAGVIGSLTAVVCLDLIISATAFIVIGAR